VLVLPDPFIVKRGAEEFHKIPTAGDPKVWTRGQSYRNRTVDGTLSCGAVQKGVSQLLKFVGIE